MVTQKEGGDSVVFRHVSRYIFHPGSERTCFQTAAAIYPFQHTTQLQHLPQCKEVPLPLSHFLSNLTDHSIFYWKQRILLLVLWFFSHSILSSSSPVTSLYQQALPFTGVALFPIAIFYSPCSPSNDPPVLMELPEGCSHHFPALALLALLLPAALFQQPHRSTKCPMPISPTSALWLLMYSKCFLSSTPITSSEARLHNAVFFPSPLRDV